jgi:hypothetical protein
MKKLKHTMLYFAFMCLTTYDLKGVPVQANKIGEKRSKFEFTFFLLLCFILLFFLLFFCVCALCTKKAHRITTISKAFNLFADILLYVGEVMSDSNEQFDADLASGTYRIRVKRTDSPDYVCNRVCFALQKYRYVTLSAVEGAIVVATGKLFIL